MSADLRITLVPAAGGTLSLLVQGGQTPPAGALLNRPALQLNPGTLEAFRRSDIPAADLDQLTSDVNTWLLDAELRGILTAALAAPGGKGGLRLVVVVPDEARDLAAQVPLELLWHDTPIQPLVIRKDVQSLVYLLAKAAPPPENPANRNWPLKILVVRSNPPDLGGLVPAVSDLKKHILERGARYGLGMVVVDVLSGEPSVGQPATWSALRRHLELTNDYNVLVYLGHGELVAPPFGGQPIGHLHLESEDGGGHQPIGSPQLAKLLSKYPIPVVLLTGCMTAADPPGVPVRQRGGEQGVAQALVNSSEAGVQVAVGMRIELRDTAAITFLKSFFTSLFGTGNAGNVDRAVWEARSELYLEAIYPPNWAAPVVLRATEREPVLDFLTQPISFPISAEMAKLLDVRAALWKSLPDFVVQEAAASLTAIMTVIDGIEDQLRAEGVKHGPLLLPARQKIAAGQKQATLPVRLAGALSLSVLRGRVQIGVGAAPVQNIDIPRAVRDAGFEIFLNPNEKSYFEVRSAAGAAIPLPAGELLLVRVEAMQVAAGVYPVTLDVQEIRPQQALWPGDNVLVVAHP